MWREEERIAQTDENEIEQLLKAVIRRYDVLFPNLEISVIFLDKTADRNEQLNRIVQALQKMKESS